MSGLLAEVRASHALPAPASAQATRKRARVTQARLGAELGVTATTVHRWETGASAPTGALRLAYARLLRDLDQVVCAAHQEAA